MHTICSLFCPNGKMSEQRRDDQSDLMQHLTKKSCIQIIVDEPYSKKIPHMSKLFRYLGIQIVIRSPNAIIRMFEHPRLNKLTRLLIPEGCTIGSCMPDYRVHEGPYISDEDETDSDQMDDDETDDETDDTNTKIKISRDAKRWMRKLVLVCNLQ